MEKPKKNYFDVQKIKKETEIKETATQAYGSKQPPTKFLVKSNGSVKYSEKKPISKRTKILLGMLSGVLVLIFIGLTDPDAPKTFEGFPSGLVGKQIPQEHFEREIPEEVITVGRDSEEVDMENGELQPHDGLGTAESVTISKGNFTINYFVVETDDEWYGDFIDGQILPKPLRKTGYREIQFKCYNDEFQGISKYFATFRNVKAKDLRVSLYLDSEFIESKETHNNQALIFEGSCYR